MGSPKRPWTAQIHGSNGAYRAETTVRPSARAENQQFAWALALKNSGSPMRSVGCTNDLSSIAPYTIGAKHVPTNDDKMWMVGWMDGNERLGLSSRMMDMPHGTRKQVIVEG
jgi:hypothetical protein